MKIYFRNKENLSGGEVGSCLVFGRFGFFILIVSGVFLEFTLFGKIKFR